MIISEKYVKRVQQKYPKIPSYIIEKDLILSYVLQELADIRELIFKGGTCLTKCYLSYHRFSEDLDFTAIVTSKPREFMKKIVLPKLDEIAKKYNLDFDSSEFNTQEKKYTPIKNHKHLFRFLLYNNAQPIKIEINISEKIIYPIQQRDIQNLLPLESTLPFPLQPKKISAYSLEEIILEKIRAILTRQEGIMERDIFDLYCIHVQKNIHTIDKKKIEEKIKSSFLYDEERITSRKKEIAEYQLFEEIHNFALIKIDSEEYIQFFEELKEIILQ